MFDFSGRNQSPSTGVEPLAAKNKIKLVVKGKPEDRDAAAPIRRVTVREKAEEGGQEAARKESRRVPAQVMPTAESEVDMAMLSPPGDLGMGIRMLNIEGPRGVAEVDKTIYFCFFCRQPPQHAIAHFSSRER